MPGSDCVVGGTVLPDAAPDDFAALDAAWEDEPVTFGPGADSGCKDNLIARLRAARRPTPTAMPE